MTPMTASPLWYVSGLRWIADVFDALADRLERTFVSHTPSANHDLYFDSDVYLGELRQRALERY